MAKALKLMTFNIEQLPWLARKIFGTGPQEPSPETRAKAVARAILDMPPREQPDMIAFNEAFNDDGRQVLLKMLIGDYPNVIKKLDAATMVNAKEDSGLMLFSKLPFLTLANGDTSHFKPFPRAAGTDAYAAKGVGFVQVTGPFNPTTVGFTHLQASTDAANTEHMDIRADQFAFIRGTLSWLTADNLQNYANTVIAGDLNVKGDPDDTSGEWNQVFAGTPGTFGADFDDGWRANMHPPNDPTDYDSGYTQRDTPTYVRNRFDYHCTRRGATMDIGLVPHHMYVPFQLPSEITDHWPLMCHLHRLSPNCSPSTAVELLAQTPRNQGQTGSELWTLATDFRDEDMYHWVYIADAGTYSVWTAPALEVHAFRRTDFSNAIIPSDILNVSQLPPSVQTPMRQAEQQLDEKGSVFAWREPFFLRFRGSSPSATGKAGFAVVRHRGESRETAILLQPHLTIDPGLPQGQPLGVTDACFFRADREGRYAGGGYEDQFRLDNLSQVSVTIELESAKKSKKVTGTAAELKIAHTGAKGPVYLILRRTNTTDTKFRVTWDCALTFLSLDESFRLHVDDETGADWPGEDELQLGVDADGDNVYFDDWDDADTGENWPGLVQSVRASVLAQQGHARWVAFTEEIGFDVLKTDGLFAHGSVSGSITPLSARDRDIELRIASIKVPDPAGDGHVTAYATISRYPLR